MKLKKLENGNLQLLNGVDIVAHFPGEMVIHIHPREEAIFITKEGGSLNVNRGYIIYADKIESLINKNGTETAFNGDKYDLLRLMSQLCFDVATAGLGSVSVLDVATEAKQDEIIQKLTPVNWETTFVYNTNDNIETETRTHGTISQSRTYTWQGDNLTNISAWR